MSRLQELYDNAVRLREEKRHAAPDRSQQLDSDLDRAHSVLGDEWQRLRDLGMSDRAISHEIRDTRSERRRSR